MSTNYRIRLMGNNLFENATIYEQSTGEINALGFDNTTSYLRSKYWQPLSYFRKPTYLPVSYYIYWQYNSVNKQASISVAGDGNTIATYIQIAVRADGPADFTCTYESDGRFKFTTTDNTFVLRFSETTNALWEIYLGITNPTDYGPSASFEYYSDRAIFNNGFYVIYDLGSGNNSSLDFVALIGPLNEIFELSNEATITLYGGNTLFIWTNPITTIDYSSKGAYKFVDDVATSSYRYWGLHIHDPYNPHVEVTTSTYYTKLKIGYIYGGDFITLTANNIANDFTLIENDPSVSTESELGALHIDKKITYGEFNSITIGNLDRDVKAQIETFYATHGQTIPFFVSFDPLDNFSSDMFDLTRFVTFSSNPVFRHIYDDLYSVSLNFKEVI